MEELTVQKYVNILSICCVLVFNKFPRNKRDRIYWIHQNVTKNILSKTSGFKKVERAGYQLFIAQRSPWFLAEQRAAFPNRIILTAAVG